MTIKEFYRSPFLIGKAIIPLIIPQVLPSKVDLQH